MENENSKKEFKIITKKYVDFIDLKDDEISPLPLIYPRMSESFNLFNLVSGIVNNTSREVLKDPELKKIAKKKKAGNKLTDEEKEKLLDLSSSNYIKEITILIPKLVTYFTWSINKHYGKQLNEQEVVVLERKILQHLEKIMIKLMDFITDMMPKGELAEKKQ